MTVVVSPMPNAFAGEVSAIDCAKPLDGHDTDAIHEGMAKHAALVFRDQPLTDEQQIIFTKQFGDIERYETPGHIRKRGEERLGSGVADFSNLTRSGSVMTPDDRIWLFKLGDRLWHSDSSFRPITAGYSLLSGRTIPARGGETEFADMRAAYDALDDETKAEIEDLVCEHSLIYSREAIGFLISLPRSEIISDLFVIGSCALTPGRAENLFSSRHMRARSSAGPFLKRECFSAI
jgi:alpha-ketoglutarate-dependent 2,4-dichlorophenoxyacetate dioxygenase